MKYTTYFNSDLYKEGYYQKNLFFDELILSPFYLSRWGNLNASEINEILCRHDLPFVLECDSLVHEKEWTNYIRLLSDINLKKVKAIRLQDPGLIRYVKTYWPELPIQLLLTVANQNKFSLEKWSGYLGKQIERLVLSSELPKDSLKDYIDSFHYPVEILGLGKVLLFYSPRKLLSYQWPEIKEIPEKLKSQNIVMAKSEESAHKGFSLIETERGTLMFHYKYLCLLEYLADLEEMKVSHLALDLRTEKQSLNNILEKFQEFYRKNDQENYKKLEASLSSPTMRGYFFKNKTDVLFKKLKNQHIRRSDRSYIGEVLEVQKKKYLVIEVKNNAEKLEEGKTIFSIDPEGNKKSFIIEFIKDMNHQEVVKSSNNFLYFINYSSKVSVKSALYWEEL